MAKILSILFLLFFLKTIYNSSDFLYSITLIDENMKNSFFINPKISENGFLYIMTGESLLDYTSFKVGDEIYERNILKFDINSGILLDKYSYKSKYPFQYSEFLLVGDNLEDLLITTIYSIELKNKKESKETQFDFPGFRRTLRKIGSYYYYAHLDSIQKNNMIINKIELSYKFYDSLPSYNIIKTSTPINTLNLISISCDSTKDLKNILCSLFNEDNKVSISIFNNNLDLIQTETFEMAENKDSNNFIKIVHFKDNGKFIILNSHNQYITRLRYFNYINGNLLSELDTIIYDGNNYLDVDETQLSPFYYENDMITTDSDKVIKIYCGGDKIIITVFHFYNYDTLLFIKIYKMFDYKDIGFDSFIHPRISIFRDTLLVCLSTFNIDRQKAGFFFINYPNSKDIDLTQKNTVIKIKDLIFIENNLFSLNLKLKILEIPKDFIFVNLLNSEIIKEEDELEIDSEIKIIQFRINEGPYNLKFEGIAIGNDEGFISSKIYPTFEKMPKSSEVYIEGREGIITINLVDCLVGYYHLEYDLNLCTNMKPKGYYLDEKERTYKACESPCSECSGPKENDTFMNCLTCMDNFYITEDTYSCYDTELENYYLDGNIYRRCHSRCSKCITGSNDNKNMSCLKCIYLDNAKEQYFYRPDILNCILSTDFQKREKMNLTILTNYVLGIFIIIVLVSLIIAFCILLCCCCKDKYKVKIEEPDNQKNNHKNENNNIDNVNDINNNNNLQKNLIEMQDKGIN